MRSAFIAMLLVLFHTPVNSDTKFGAWEWESKSKSFETPKKRDRLKENNQNTIESAFSKETRNNPLLLMARTELFETLSFLTSGYCDKRVQYHEFKCNKEVSHFVRKVHGYDARDFGDPRVYERAYRLWTAYLKTNRQLAISFGRDYGYKEAFLLKLKEE